jgi:Bax protein
MNRTASAAGARAPLPPDALPVLLSPARLLAVAALAMAGLALWVLLTAPPAAQWWPAAFAALPATIDAAPSPEAEPEPETVTRIAGKAANELYRLYVERGFVLDAARQGTEIVPRLIVERLPRDMGALDSTDLRKAVFIKTLLPLLLMENERLLAERARLEDALAAGADASPADREWLAELAERYDADPARPRELLRRVDAIPVSLAIAQAAIETGWGTSRVAQAGQALFGQMAFRAGDEDGRVRKFEQLEHAVAAYAANLNTHRAYADFRRAREQARREDKPLDGHALAQHLQRYSERGMDYVRDVRSLMRVNGLRAFDRARLDSTAS